MSKCCGVHSRAKIVLGSCVDVLLSLLRRGCKVNVITDPPYGEVSDKIS